MKENCHMGCCRDAGSLGVSRGSSISDPLITLLILPMNKTCVVAIETTFYGRIYL